MNQRGFTYIGAMLLVAITGIALTGVSTYWSTIVKREKEAELLFRGDQIRRAIASYYQSNPGSRQPQYPRSLDELLKDPRYPTPKRHLRKKYANPLDPESGWTLLLDGKRRIKGIYANSSKRPLKRGNFPRDYQDFAKARSYADWKFVHNP